MELFRFSYFFVAIVALSATKVNSLECFVCSGEDCNTVSGSTTIVNCETNEATPPPPTDYDDIQNDFGDNLAKSDNIPMLEEFEEDIENLEEAVVLDSGLAKSIGGAAFSRSHVTQFSDNGFRCFKASFEESGSQQTLRGCARLEDGADEINICTAATAVDVPLMDCQLCSEPLCNAAYRVAPVTALGAVLFIMANHILTHYGNFRIQ